MDSIISVNLHNGFSKSGTFYVTFSTQSKINSSNEHIQQLNTIISRVQMNSWVE
jgi:hypothetical protein